MKSIKSRINAGAPRHNIQTKYKSLNVVKAFLGAAKSAEEEVAQDGQGAFQGFSKRRHYWHPSTGTHEVHGAILFKWNASPENKLARLSFVWR